MKKTVVLAAVLCVASTLPASAHVGPGRTRVTFEAAPCVAACPRYLPNRNPCADVFAEATFDAIDVVMPVVPAGKIPYLEVSLDLSVDWDLYLCSSEGTVLERSEVGIIFEPCYALFLQLGCHEDVGWAGQAGEVITIRAVNVSDPGPATAYYWFTAIPAD